MCSSWTSSRFNLNNLEFGSIFLGTELNYAVIPFTLELRDDIGRSEETLANVIINQMVVSTLIKVKSGKGNVLPFIRLGGGAYMGSSDLEYSDALKTFYNQQFGETLEDEEQDIKAGFGFNAGS